jgi:hypothetical protein
MRRARGGVVAGVLAMGCGREPSPAAGDAAGARPAAPRAMLDEARRELADPERTPLRRGLVLDAEGLRQALVRLRAEHGPQVAAAYQAGIDALPEGALPSAEGFGEVARFTLPDDPAARDVEAVNWLFDPDVRATVRRVLGTYLTLMMVHDMGMTTADVGVWMAFFHAAEPALRRCGGSSGAGLVLCLDYGSDVFVLDMERKGPAWVVTQLRWMQAGHVAG